MGQHCLSLYLYKSNNVSKIAADDFSRRHFQMIFAGALRFNPCHAEPGFIYLKSGRSIVHKLFSMARVNVQVNLL